MMTIKQGFVGIAMTLAAAAGVEAATCLKATATASVRTGPGSGYALLGKVPAGHQYVGISQSNGWWKIYFDGRTAYTYRTAWKGVAGTTGVKVNIDMLNVRSGPGLGHSIVGKVYRGQIYRWASTTNGWYKIYFGGTLRYVYGAYVSKVSLSGSTTSTSSSTTTTITRLSLPWYKQQTGYWCGPTTVQICVKYLTGRYYSQYYLAKWLGTNSSRGTSIPDSLHGLRHFSGQSYTNTSYNRARILKNIHNKRPVPLSFVCRYVSYSRYSSAKHISPIKGYTSNGYVICDTAWGATKYATNGEVYNATRYFGSWALLVRF